MSWPTPESLAVYIHWPFCAKKCPYCDFAVTVRAHVDEAAVVQALSRSLEHWAETYRRAGTVPRAHSIYFGGGTPSLMSAQSVEMLISQVQHSFGTIERCEVTLEANPTDAELERFAAYKAAGVNRLSLGVQSLDDTELLVLGRNHDADQARRALDETARVFVNFSVDLMYALPRQNTENWQARLDEVLAWRPPHVSLYQLTFEQGTVFEKAVSRGILKAFDQDAAADLYLTTVQQLEQAGLAGYEVSNHAKPGFESQHNLSYWRYQDYVGVGPGAHGRLSLGGRKHASENLRAYSPWQDSALGEGAGVLRFQPLGEQEAAEEAFLMSLRSTEGARLSEHLDLDSQRLDELRQAGLIEGHANSFRATREGWLVLDSLTGHLLA